MATPSTVRETGMAFFGNLPGLPSCNPEIFIWRRGRQRERHESQKLSRIHGDAFHSEGDWNGIFRKLTRAAVVQSGVDLRADASYRSNRHLSYIGTVAQEQPDGSIDLNHFDRLWKIGRPAEIRQRIRHQLKHIGER